MNLQYRAGTSPDDLRPGECVVRGSRAEDGLGRLVSEQTSGTGKTVSFWNLWFCAIREDNGQQELFAGPVNPRGPYIEKSQNNRRTWGLADLGGGCWQISPSIHFTPDVPGGKSVWHQTPTIVGVPAGEPWT